MEWDHNEAERRAPAIATAIRQVNYRSKTVDKSVYFLSVADVVKVGVIQHRQ